MSKILPFLILYLVFTSAHAQNNAGFCEQISALQHLIQTEHYSPKSLDDSLSKGVHGLFLKFIDPDRRFFLTTDFLEFKTDLYELDDYIRNGNCDFITKYIETLTQRVLDSKTNILSFEKEAFDFSGKDTLYFDADKSSRELKNASHAKHYWNKRLRYKLATTAIEEDTVFERVQSNFKTLQKQLRPKIIEREICILDGILLQNGGLEKFVKEAFLNALVSYQDPNSSFLNLSEKNMFEDHLSSSQLSFGIQTEKSKDGEIVIAQVIPGSAAYENGNFDRNDIIQSLTFDSETLDTYCVSNEDVIAFTNDTKHTTLTFKIKKQNGSIHLIQLTKTLLKVEENMTRAYILEGDTKLGYINIPSFYTDMEDFQGLGLANDVAKELYKLNKETVDGLVLDLRFNGGGSMKEASDLAGMFIDRGPISVLRYRNGDTFTVRDPNRGTLFSKPLLILVNEFSASASEYLAATLQDYHRAILVGAPTHGKASAQVLLPLSNEKDLGFCKLTVEKFYRITGKSHQSIGVIPDLELPSLYDNFDTREKYEEYSLKNDTIQVKTTYTPLKSFPLEKLREESEKRLAKNPVFEGIKSINQQLVLNYIKKNIQYPLTLENINDDMTGYFDLWKEYFNLLEEQEPASYTVKNTVSTHDILSYNADNMEKNEEVLRGISKDTYLQEAYSILSDYIKLNPSH